MLTILFQMCFALRCAAFHPILDLAEKFGRAPSEVEPLFADSVHTTAQGAEFYAQ